MSQGIRLDDVALTAASSSLAAAATRMLRRNVRRPRAVPTVSGVSGEIERFLRALEVAREALSAATESAGLAVTSLAEHGTALDADTAAAVPGDTVRNGGTR